MKFFPLGLYRPWHTTQGELLLSLLTQAMFLDCFQGHVPLLVPLVRFQTQYDFFLCLILFCRSNLLIHAGLLPPLLVSFLSRWTILELEGSDPEKSISSIESLFYLGVSLMQFSQAGPKRGKSLLSWSPGLVSCCFPQFFPCRILNSTTAWSLKPRPFPTSASPTSSSLPLKKK